MSASNASSVPAEFAAGLECDLVMKGGITSGIVYPPAILRIARKYRFRSIGGTSAGAIAAVLTAAAEYGREGGGFERLDGIRIWLSERGNLLGLFQPKTATAPLLRLLLALNAFQAGEPRTRGRRATPDPARDGGGWMSSLMRWIVIGVPRCFAIASPVWFTIGALVGLAKGAWLAHRLVYEPGAWPAFSTPGVAGFEVVAAVALGYLAACIAALAHLLTVLLRGVPEQQFGVCSGMPSNAAEKPEALTPWLHRQIQTLAGLPADGTPLTVAQLRSKQHDGQDAGVELKMVTSCLSLGRPFVLPIENDLFLFSVKEFERLFPKEVVDHLVKHARRTLRLVLTGDSDVHVLPEPDDMPVGVLARMSLSFPLLLSAVPLHVVSREAFRRHQTRRASTGRPDERTFEIDPTKDLTRVWFSDGGICSNFPIHFFDAWLPTRPTFGINLTSYPPETFADSVTGAADAPAGPRRWTRARNETMALRDDDDDVERLALHEQAVAPDRTRAVFLPVANRRIHPPAVPMSTLPGFLGAIWSTAQDYKDNMLAELPSYRERIAQIRFSPDEGGLNLAMDTEQIKNIVGKGVEAGELLEDFDFDEHRWVRFRSFMAQFEHQLVHLRSALTRSDYDALLRDLVRRDYPYFENDVWREEARLRLASLRRLADEWAGAVSGGGPATAPTGAGGDPAASPGARDEAAAETRVSRPDLFGSVAPKPEGVLRVTPRV
ncbi:MAG: hypothetical protein ACHQ52_01940 [Candidatus Eisenbacteria bacterium]